LSLLLLLNDRSLPWLILGAEREGINEIDELSTAERSVLIEEIACVSGVIRELYHPVKINVGHSETLFRNCMSCNRKIPERPCWPGPIWGTGPIVAYGTDELNEVSAKIRASLKGG